MTQDRYVTGWNDAIRSAVTVISSGEAHGYVPDVGCYGCFARIAEAISAITMTTPSTPPATKGVTEEMVERLKKYSYTLAYPASTDGIDSVKCGLDAIIRELEATPSGCGLAGYSPEQIAPMFEDSPANVILPAEFPAHLSKEG